MGKRKEPYYMTIHAIYENGVFRPTVKVDLPDACEVEVEIRRIKEESNIQAMTPGLADIYAILGERFDTGETDIAERHNEHQP
jgi:predicted DNA-binding antitoxin AbrB/MazE fold protein